jgi:hypothetical protein
MTSATTQPAKGAGARDEEGRGYGLIALYGLCAYGSRANLAA